MKKWETDNLEKIKNSKSFWKRGKLEKISSLKK